MEEFEKTNSFSYRNAIPQQKHETKISLKGDITPKPILDLHAKNPLAMLMWEEMVSENYESLKANNITSNQVLNGGDPKVNSHKNNIKNL